MTQKNFMSARAFDNHRKGSHCCGPFLRQDATTKTHSDPVCFGSHIHKSQNHKITNHKRKNKMEK